jgi:ABC-type branched-subunit amino acid transport system substrate-binding protein
MRGKKLGRWLGVLAATTLAAAAVAPAAGSVPAGKAPPEVPGFDGETIKLGVITPLSGIASVVGKPLTNGQVTYWDSVNDDGGVGGKYPVELVQEDSEYDVATAIQAYGKIKGDVVAFQQILGTEIVKSILPRLKADGLTGAPATLDSLWVNVPELVPIGAPYQVEAINGFDYYLRNGGEGKKICAIAQDDEYGGAGLDGLKFAAKKLRFKVAKTVRFATGSDVSAQVGELADTNCEAVFLASLPNDTAAILSKVIGRNFEPQIIGLAPTWLSGFEKLEDLQSFLVNHFWLTAEGPAWGDTTVPGEAQLIADHDKYAPDQTPDQYYAFGYAQAWAIDQVLEKAVDNGDLSKKGIRKAVDRVGRLKFGGLLGDYKYGKSADDRDPPRATTIFKIEPGQPIGLTILEPGFASKTARQFDEFES